MLPTGHHHMNYLRNNRFENEQQYWLVILSDTAFDDDSTGYFESFRQIRHDRMKYEMSDFVSPRASINDGKGNGSMYHVFFIEFELDDTIVFLGVR